MMNLSDFCRFSADSNTAAATQPSNASGQASTAIAAGISGAPKSSISAAPARQRS
jgi:hypothetical protein